MQVAFAMSKAVPDIVDGEKRIGERVMHLKSYEHRKPLKGKNRAL